MSSGSRFDSNDARLAGREPVTGDQDGAEERQRQEPRSGGKSPEVAAAEPTDRPNLSPVQLLLATLPQQGRLEWIGLRPARRTPLVSVEGCDVEPGQGLIGDRFQGRVTSRRQVTLIQAEHLEAVGSLLGRGPIDPGNVRRNLVVRGLNLLALKGRPFRIGSVVLEMTGLCHPCSRMEEALGAGGYNAMRGHGGITARVISGGRLQRGDEVAALPAFSELVPDDGPDDDGD